MTQNKLRNKLELRRTSNYLLPKSAFRHSALADVIGAKRVKPRGHVIAIVVG